MEIEPFHQSRSKAIVKVVQAKAATEMGLKYKGNK